MDEDGNTNTLFEYNPPTRVELLDLLDRINTAMHALWMNAVNNVSLSRETRERVWAKWCRLQDRRFEVQDLI